MDKLDIKTDDELAYINKLYTEILKYDHDDYQEMKDETGWFNKEVAKIVGFKHMSVKNQTRTSNPLPIWAQMLVYVWRMEYKKYKYFPKGGEVEKFQALLSKYKVEFNHLMEENAKLTTENEALKLKLRKEERNTKKITTLYKKLLGIEKESKVTISANSTLTELKRELNSLESKHNRKIKVLENMEVALPQATIVKNKKKGVVANKKLGSVAPKKRNKTSNKKVGVK